MKLKSFHKTEGHNTPKNTYREPFSAQTSGKQGNPCGHESHRLLVMKASAKDRSRSERSTPGASGSSTSESFRQARRAALYRRRARQLFFYKALALLLLIAGAGLFLMNRLSAPSVSTSVTAAASADDTNLASATLTDASAGALLSNPLDSSVAAALTSVVPAGSHTDFNAFMEAALEKCAYLADLTNTASYQISGDVSRSEVAASFFTGFTPVETAETVRIPAGESTTSVSGTESTKQGSNDDYGDTSVNVGASTADDVFLDSESAVLINLDTGEIVAERNADMQVYPASMTKVLSMLCAEEQITDRTGTFTITRDITDLTFSEALSSVCWDVGESVTLPDLEYGTILHSGADAAIGMARYSVGSEEALVRLMNERVKAMGLSEKTHFTNVTGQFDENQTVTVIDMAMIMKAAVSNERMLEVMRTGEYTTSSTPEHPDGIYIFNKFLDRTQNTEMSGEVVCVKTGYTIESLNCAVSYYVSASGAHYICVTALGHGSRRVVTDHVNLYETYAK